MSIVAREHVRYKARTGLDVSGIIKEDGRACALLS